jgi:hypothetical protein
MLVEPSHSPAGRLFFYDVLKKGCSVNENSHIKFNPVTKGIEIEFKERLP